MLPVLKGRNVTVVNEGRPVQTAERDDLALPIVGRPLRPDQCLLNVPARVGARLSDKDQVAGPVKSRIERGSRPAVVPNVEVAAAPDVEGLTAGVSEPF
jgi:hypothetical protein